MSALQNTIDIMAIYIIDGVIGVIEPWGETTKYRQKGIGILCEDTIKELIEQGILSEEVMDLRELPNNYRIYFEDKQILGIAEDTINLKGWINRDDN